MPHTEPCTHIIQTGSGLAGTPSVYRTAASWCVPHLEIPESCSILAARQLQDVTHLHAGWCRMYCLRMPQPIRHNTPNAQALDLCASFLDFLILDRPCTPHRPLEQHLCLPDAVSSLQHDKGRSDSARFEQYAAAWTCLRLPHKGRSDSARIEQYSTPLLGLTCTAAVQRAAQTLSTLVFS